MEAFWNPWTWQPITGFTAALVVVGIGQACLFFWQLGFLRSADETARRAADASAVAAGAATAQTSIALKSYIATSRAWVDVTPFESLCSLTWDEEKGATFDVFIKAANSGNSPALEANVTARLTFQMVGQSDPRSRVREFCISNETTFLTNLIFTNDEFQQRVMLIVSRAEIAEYVENFSALYNVSACKVCHTAFLLIVGVCYKVVGDDTWHHTGRMFSVAKRDVGVPLAETDFLPGEVVLTRQYMGDYAD